MKIQGSGNYIGELWGGLAAMLVALPSAIAFGVTVLSPLGPVYAAQGALAGILGTIVLGLVAPAFGGTNRLITSPSAPAAAVMAAYAVELARGGIAPGAALLQLTLIGLICGVLQLIFGLARLGRLIKYMPYPVVSGFMTGVGLVIVVGQIPKFLGVPKGTSFWASLVSFPQWDSRSIVVGGVTAVVMVIGPRLTKVVPSAILGLLAGGAAYLALGSARPAMFTLAGNPLVIGPLSAGVGLLASLSAQLRAIRGLEFALLGNVLQPALTLAVLLSIDTLKTSVILDSLTRTRHDSNRELVGQGLANIGTALVGGIPGSGQTGATLVNMASGGQTRLSGVLEGAFAFVAFLLLGNVIAWLPVAALAGILIVVGVRMCDRESLNLLRSPTTLLDFGVIVVVVVVAQSVSLMAASALGVGLAVLLFLRELIGGSVVRSRMLGSEVFSRRQRLPEEIATLERCGERTVIFQLQGSLFFGTADQLYTALEPDLKTRTYIVLDMRRVQSVDVTAARVLEQIEDILAERQAFLFFCHFTRKLSTGQDLARYFKRVGIVRAERTARIFDTRDDALLWIENRILAEELPPQPPEALLELREMALFAERKPETIAALEACMELASYKAGETIFSRKDPGERLLLIRRGLVRIEIPVGDSMLYHVSTFGRGDYIGEISFLDRKRRSAHAVAVTDTDLYILSRDRFDALAEEHKKIAMQLMEAVASTLATRLRRANKQIRALQEG
ncbi:MAG TPA: SulP family inorganic anion transporter [Candidatus Acidoferrales bacterium]|nr:SulP family inorganic anion transporter [Candidatus Acidoferrales bacterium]